MRYRNAKSDFAFHFDVEIISRIPDSDSTCSSEKCISYVNFPTEATIILYISNFEIKSARIERVSHGYIPILPASCDSVKTRAGCPRILITMKPVSITSNIIHCPRQCAGKRNFSSYREYPGGIKSQSD